MNQKKNERLGNIRLRLFDNYIFSDMDEFDSLDLAVNDIKFLSDLIEELEDELFDLQCYNSERE